MKKQFEMRKVRERGKKAKKGRKKKPGPKKAKISKSAKDTAARLAAKGATNEQLAAGLNVSTATFYRLMQFDPELKKRIKEAAGEADDAVEVALYARAIGYEVTEDTFERSREGMVLTKRVPKHLPPDPKAAGIWLYNRRRDVWKQRQTFEDGDGNAMAPVFVVPAFNNSVSVPSASKK